MFTFSYIKSVTYPIYFANSWYLRTLLRLILFFIMYYRIHIKNEVARI